MFFVSFTMEKLANYFRSKNTQSHSLIELKFYTMRSIYKQKKPSERLGLIIYTYFDLPLIINPGTPNSDNICPCIKIEKY